MNLITIIWSLSLLALSATTKSTASATTTASHDNNAKYQATTSSGVITTVAGFKTVGGGAGTDGIAATSALLNSPSGLVLDKDGTFYIAVTDDNKIRKVVASTGFITTVAGTGVAGYSGDLGQATLATLNTPKGLGFDTSGNVFIADSENNCIRKLTVSTGVITTVAGNGKSGYGADSVAATSTTLSSPNDVAVDTSGNIFIADTGNRRIRKVTASTGVITTIAGPGGSPGVAIEPNTAATNFHLHKPTGVTVDTSGNVYIAGYIDPCILKITVTTGFISVVAGTGPFNVGTAGYNGDDILATTAQLNKPIKVVFDSAGNMFVADSENHRVRKITVSTGLITTVAGTGATSTSPNDGEGGSALVAPISQPYGIAVDAVGNFLFADNDLGVVRKVAYADATPIASATQAPSVTRVPSSAAISTPTISSSKAPNTSPVTSTNPTPSASVSSISKVPTPAPITSTSKAPAPAPTSSVASQSSATTHVAEALHLAMILLSSVLILYLCRDE